jgi:hypothetical protein
MEFSLIGFLTFCSVTIGSINGKDILFNDKDITGWRILLALIIAGCILWTIGTVSDLVVESKWISNINKWMSQPISFRRKPSEPWVKVDNTDLNELLEKAIKITKES